MKKIIALLLAVLYITVSSGVVLNVHYCMGKVSSVKVDNFRSTFCKCGKSLSTAGCCRTEIRVVKLSNDHKATTATTSIKIPSVAFSFPVSLIYDSEVNAAAPLFAASKAPPDVSTKAYIKNCVFRI